MMRRLILILFTALSMTSHFAVAETPQFEVIIQDHKFSPETLTVPVEQKIRLKIINKDASPEEFESYSLNREKIIPGNSSAMIFIGPLKAGEYEFFGEFHEATAKGKIIAR